MSFFRISLLILAVAVFSACQPVIQPAPPLPTVSIWQVQYTPATAWLAPYFQTCAKNQAGVNLVVSEHPSQSLDAMSADFSFMWGERLNPPPFAAVIAHDSLAIVVNPANPLLSLTVSEAQGLFSAKDGSWSPLIAVKCPTCGADFSGPVKAYVYAPSDEMQVAANWIQAGPEAILVPGPGAVVAAIASERNSIGFIPARWLDSTIKQVTIVGTEPGMVNHPVLALAPAEPQGPKRAWLSCLQEQIQ